jgi:uncharacterized protein YukE
MSMTFDMGAETLSQLSTDTSSSHDDLTAQVRALFEAAAPLEGAYNGRGRAAFDAFKSDGDDLAAELNRALAAVLGGIDGQHAAFVQGEDEMETDTAGLHGRTDVDPAVFSSRRA